jgi:serine/threonine protein kinase/HEAT repeat protein
MATNTVELLSLPDEQRRVLESWLVDFDLRWAEGRLAARAGELPADNFLRRLALVEMAKIDLERHWQRGRRPCVEDYLRDYPELGTSDTVPADLIHTEYEVRRQFGAAADPTDFARRFPRQVEELRRLLAQPSPSETDRVRGRTDTAFPRTSGSTLEGEAPPPPRELPVQLGRYRILRRLGGGGMGTVWLAHDTQLDRAVALKVPHFTAADGPGALERFLREARAAATLDHPNLCPVYDAGEVNGTHYLTMAYIEGQPLSELVQGNNPLPERRAAELVRRIALALAEAHARGVIHRDLKPSNVMLNRRGEPVVMDFGLARRLGRADERLTQSGSLLGTPAYMAPEQVEGRVHEMGPPTDVYALGVILYELLTGRRPFEGSMGAVLGQIVIQPPAPPSTLRPGLDSRLEAACLRALAKRPGDRFASMDQLATALDVYLQAATVPERPSSPGSDTGTASPRPRWRGKSWLVAGTAAVLLAVVLTVVLLVKGDGYGTVKIELPDGVTGVTVEVDGEQIDIKGLDEPVRLKPGKHSLEVRGANFKTFTREIVLKRGGKEAVKVTLEPEPVADPGRTPGSDRPTSTDWGTVRIDVDAREAKDAVVRVDRNVLTIKKPGEPIRLSAGKHQLEVTRGDVVVETREFTVRRGDNNEGIKITLPPAPPLPPVVQALAEALKDKDAAVRVQAVVSLSEQKGSRAAVEALAQILQDKDSHVRRATARALAKLGDKAAAPALVRRVADDLWGEEASGFLVPGDSTPYENVATGERQGSKYAALDALKALNAKSVPGALKQALQSKTPAVRTWAARRLGEYPSAAVVEALGQALSDGEARVRRAAAWSLGKLGDKAAVPALVRRVGDDLWGEEASGFLVPGDSTPYENVATGERQGSKYAALDALKTLDDKSVPGALTQALKSKNAAVRAWAVRELGKLKDSK